MNDTFSSSLFHWTISEIKKILAQNQFASGGLMVMLLGAALAYARTLPSQLWNWLWGRIFITLEINSEDRAFEWFQTWLSDHPQTHRARSFGLSARNRDQRGGFEVGHKDDEKAPRAVIFPIDGTLRLRFGQRTFWLSSSREKMKKDGSFMTGLFETLEVRTLWTNRTALAALVRAAYQSTVLEGEKRIEIMTPRWNDWHVLSRVVPRDPASLVYARDLHGEVVRDARTFLKSERWYSEMGIPWRRGYLLYGPPGNGKSSLVTAIAGSLGKNVCVLNLASSQLNDESLTNLLGDAPEGSIVLLEDIDAVFSGRERSHGNDSKLSFNGVLNALDGVTAQQGRMVFMTTNHLEKLDPALIRPGRADVHVFVGNASRDQVRRMLERFFPEIEASTAQALAARLPDGVLSMARVQEFLVRHRENLPGALERWYELANEQSQPKLVNER
jgi:chaperone BCS1